MKVLERADDTQLTPARTAAIVRCAVVTAIYLSDRAEEPAILEEDSFNVLLALAFVWAVAMAISSFGGRRVKIARFEVVVDLLLLSAIVYVGGGPVADGRRAFFVFPVIAAATQTTRTTGSVGVASLAAFTASSLLGGWGKVDGALASTLASDIYLVVIAVASMLAAALVEAQRKGALEEAERNRLLSRQLLEVRDTERQELAQWLHDEPVQLLVASRMEIDAVRSGSGDAADRLEDRIELAEKHLREAAFELSPYALEELGLCEAVKRVAEESCSARGMDLVMDCASLPPHDHDRAYFAIARELISNATRHSFGYSLDVEIEADGDGIRLVVEDDGVGIDPKRRLSALTEGHLGLVSARERAASVGAELKIERSGPGGTRIAVAPRA